MRRGVLAIIGTVAGTGLLVGAKLGTPAPVDPNAAMADTGATASGAGTAPSTGTSGAAKAANKAAAGGLKDGTYTGKAAAAGVYEQLTVSITVANGKLTAAKGDPGAVEGTTAQITGSSLPKLQQEALAAQSSKVATVSGATYTSGAYRMSLQSAIDQAKA